MSEINNASNRIYHLKLADVTEIGNLNKAKTGGPLEDFLDAAQELGMLDRTLPNGTVVPGGYRDDVYAHAKSWSLFELDESFTLAQEVRESLTPAKVREIRVVPLRLQDNRLHCATTNPGDYNLRRTLQALTSRPVELHYSSEKTIDLLIDKYFSTHHEAATQGELASLEVMAEQVHSVSRQDATAVQQALNAIIEGALQQGEADIHIEHFMDHLEVRYGKGSNLRRSDTFPSSLGGRLANIIRSKAKIKEPEFQCQNGTLTHRWNGVEYSLRVGILPAVFGPSITLRLGQDRAWKLDDIGMKDVTLRRWRSVIENKNGLFLVTGPMGSGKTVLLQATAESRAGAGRKTVALEAPVEYRFPQYVTQVQVEKSLNRDWNQVMPTVLRSAASTILLGEINESEIGKTAVDAANTGHQVFSTLHTNDAVTSITRLREFGILPSVLSDVMRAVCAQRLVETLCPNCKVPGAPAERHLELFQVSEEAMRTATWFEKNPKGCEDCQGSGISGRAPIHELMTFDENIRDLVSESAPTKLIREAAVEAGMIPLAQSALELATSGLTSLSLAREEITF